MKKKIIVIAITIFIELLTGCGRLNSIHREINIDQGRGALIDIKQRAILVGKRDDKIVVCAEPSPDALSAYAAELTTKLPKMELLESIIKSQERSEFVGFRTQSIQLLRDALYRLCEGYMNGAIDASQYSILMRRYQKYMVALLAIEQLTGSTKPSQIDISFPDKNVQDEVSDPTNKDQIKDQEAEVDHILILWDQKNKSDIAKVSETVKEIVTKITKTDDGDQLCWAHLTEQLQKKKVSSKEDALYELCIEYFKLRDLSRIVNLGSEHNTTEVKTEKMHKKIDEKRINVDTLSKIIELIGSDKMEKIKNVWGIPYQEIENKKK